MKQSAWKKYGIYLLAASGIITALPLIFPVIGFLQWISIIPVACVIIAMAADREIKLFRIYLAGLVFFESYFLVVFHWFISMYPLEFTGISKGAAIFVVALAWIGVSLLEACVYSLAVLAFAALSRMNFMKGIKAVLLMPFAAASLWTVFEWIQTLDWWGVPWGRLCLGQVNYNAFFASASLLGSYFVTFCIVAVNFFAACAVMTGTKKQTLCAVCALCVFLLNLSLGMVTVLSYEDSDKSIRVAAIQGNNPNSNIWDDNTIYDVLDVHERLTRDAARNGADIVVWSETAFPFNFFKFDILPERISSLAKETGVTILVSAFTESEQSDILYVSIIEAKPDGSFGEVTYHKQRLVPFGEFVPMRELIVKLIPPLGELKTLEEGIAAGIDSTVIYTDQAAVGAAICYDSIFEEILRASVNNGAEILIVSTNDSWFGTSSALGMHNSQAVLRSVELGRYIVRSANTGISSIISPRGEVIQRLPAAVEGYVIDDVALNTQKTVYTVVGNVFVYACMAFCLVLAIVGGVDLMRASKPSDNKKL